MYFGSSMDENKKGEKSEIISMVLVTSNEVIFRSSLEPDPR